MADRVIQRNDTAARWQSINPILATGEIGIEIDGAKGYKIGDGKTRWNDLPYPANPTNVVQDLGNNENAVPSQKLVTEKLTELGSEVNKNSLGLNISSIEEEEDFNQYPLRLYTILDSGLYGSSSTYRHILIPVSSDECVSVQATIGNEAKLAWFKSDAPPVKGGTPDYVDGTSLFVVPANTDAYFGVPKGAKFLYVYLGSEGIYEYTPKYVKIRKAKIVDNLESEDADYSLSAKQGKVLNDKVLKNSKHLEHLDSCMVSNPDFNPNSWTKYTILGEIGETPTNGTSASFGRYEIEINGALFISVSVIGVVKTTQYVTFIDDNNIIIDKIDVFVSADYERITLDYIPVPSTAVKVAVNTYKDAGNVGENYVKVWNNLGTELKSKEIIFNKRTNLNNPDDITYPTTKATYDSIAEHTAIIRAEKYEVSSNMQFGKYISASGTGFGYSEKRAASEDYYQVNAGVVYDVTNDGNYKITIYTYNSNKEFIKQLGWFVDIKSFKVEQNGYIRVSVEDDQEINEDNYIPLCFERKSFVEAAIESIEKTNNEQDNEIQNIKNKVEQQSSHVSCPLSAIEKTIGIKKPYYFETVFSGYGIESLRPIDDMLDKVPKGKHFIVYSDSHVSYNLYQHDGVACGWKNPVEPLIQYAKTYLGGCKVVYGGDFIGNWLTGSVNPRDFVINQYKYFANLCYGEFGNDYLYCIGDHDTFNGGTDAKYRPKVSEIHSIMFKNTQCVYDVDAFDAIDNCTLITSDEEREQFKSIFGMNYYVDDYTNKIRFIIFIGTGIGFTNGQDALNIDMGYSGAAFIPFIKKALQNVPDGFDVVLCGHEYGSGTASGYPLHLHINTNKFYTRTMYKLCLSFMKGEAGTLNPFEYWSGTDHIFEVMKDLVMQLSGDNSTNVAYDFSNRKDRPKLFWCCGDKHIDAAGFLYGSGVSSTSEQEAGAKLDEFATDQSRNDGILVLSFDRACITDQGSLAKKYYSDGYRDVWTAKNDNGDRNNTAEDWENTETNVWTKRHGTPKDVLFHIVTIGDDGYVTINRIGAEGIKYDGEGNIVETTMERKYRIPTGI